MHYNCVLSSESEPKCEINSTSEFFALEGEYRKYSCEVTYAGKWAPVMTLLFGGEHVTDVKNETKGNALKFSIVINMSNASEITCQANFVKPKRETFPHNAATNTPYFNRRCSIRAPAICCKYLLFDFVFMCLR